MPWADSYRYSFPLTGKCASNLACWAAAAVLAGAQVHAQSAVGGVSLEQLLHLSEAADAPLSVDVSPNGRWVAVERSHSVTILELSTGKIVTRLPQAARPTW